jgi:hypothetical protein
MITIGVLKFWEPFHLDWINVSFFMIVLLLVWLIPKYAKYRKNKTNRKSPKG